MTASHTMIARAIGHDEERRGHTIMTVGYLALAVLLLSIAASHLWPPRTLTDTTHEIR